jgi:hypothetical protein
MIQPLFKAYRKMIEQAWMPIFVDDTLDTPLLLEGCRRAGLSVVEYTLRRKDARKIVPTLKESLPDTVVLMGSTIDCDEIVEERKKRFPQLMTLSELAPYVDGFVSMLPYSDETLRLYSKTHLCIPTAESGGEALGCFDHGLPESHQRGILRLSGRQGGVCGLRCRVFLRFIAFRLGYRICGSGVDFLIPAAGCKAEKHADRKQYTDDPSHNDSFRYISCQKLHESSTKTSTILRSQCTANVPQSQERS